MAERNPVQEAIDVACSNLVREVLAASHIVVRIPGWEPVDFSTGMNWMRESLSEGFYVGYKITRAEDQITIWMKTWEYGDQEPTWETIIP